MISTSKYLFFFILGRILVLIQWNLRTFGQRKTWKNPHAKVEMGGSNALILQYTCTLLHKELSCFWNVFNFNFLMFIQIRQTTFITSCLERERRICSPTAYPITALRRWLNWRMRRRCGTILLITNKVRMVTFQHLCNILLGYFFFLLEACKNKVVWEKKLIYKVNEKNILSLSLIFKTY